MGEDKSVKIEFTDDGFLDYLRKIKEEQNSIIELSQKVGEAQDAANKVARDSALNTNLAIEEMATALDAVTQKNIENAKAILEGKSATSEYLGELKNQREEQKQIAKDQADQSKSRAEILKEEATARRIESLKRHKEAEELELQSFGLWKELGRVTEQFKALRKAREEALETGADTTKLDKQLAKVKKSLDGTTAAYDAERKKIESLKRASRDLSAVDSELSKQKKDSEQAIDDYTEAIEESIAAMDDENEGQRENIGIVGTLKNLYEDFVEKMIDFIEETDNATEATKQLSENTGELNEEKKKSKKDSKSLTEAIVDGFKNFKIYGVNIGRVVSQLKNLRLGLLNSTKGINSTGKSYSKFNRLLKFSIIGIIVTVLAALAAVLTRTQKGLDFVNKSMAVFNSTIDVLVGRSEDFIFALKNIVTLNFREGVEGLKDTFRGLGAEIKNAAIQAIALAEKSKALKLFEEQLGLLTARRQEANEASRRAFDDDTKSFKQREAELSKLIKSERELDELREIAAIEKLKIARETNELTKRSGAIPNKETEIELEKEFLSIVAERAATEAGYSADLRGLRKQASDEYKRQQEQEAERVKKLQEDYDQLFKSLENQAIALELEELTGVQRIERERQIANDSLQLLEQSLMEAALLNGASEEEIKEIKELGQQARIDLNEKFNRRVLDLELDRLSKELQAITDSEDEKAKAKREAFNQEVDFLKIFYARELAEIETFNQENFKQQQEAGEEQLSFAEFIEKRKTEVTIKEATERLEAVRKLFGADSLEFKILELQIEKLEQDLEKIGDTDLSPINKFKKRILEALEINEEEFQALAGVYSNAVSRVLESIDQISAAKIEAAEKEIQVLQKSLSEQEDILKEQLDLQERSEANSADLAQKALDEEHKRLEAAEAKKAVLEAKAAKRQLHLENLQVVSNLTVAATEVFAAESHKGLLGVVFAIGAIATIFAQVQKYRALAKKIAAPELRQGVGKISDADGILVGESHSGPNRGIDGVYQDKDGNLRLVKMQGGEHLMPVEQSEKYREPLEAMRGNKAPSEIMEAYSDIAGFSRSDIYKSIVQQRQPGIENTPLRHLKTINHRSDEIANHQRQSEQENKELLEAMKRNNELMEQNIYYNKMQAKKPVIIPADRPHIREENLGHEIRRTKINK